MRFRDRADAGRRLVRQLADRVGESPIVLALPRGGVPVGFEVARELAAPLDVLVVRKLGVPGRPELGMGAISEAGIRLINPVVVRLEHVSADQIAAVERSERAELDRRVRRFRGDRPRVDLADRTAVIVDDGLATGYTARAACAVARGQGARRVVVAAPVASRESLADLAERADDVVCVHAPPVFRAIGEFYADFRQTSDAEVVRLLEAAGPGR
jgi:putative phosphoribosyl transferase